VRKQEHTVENKKLIWRRFDKCIDVMENFLMENGEMGKVKKYCKHHKEKMKLILGRNARLGPTCCPLCHFPWHGLVFSIYGLAK
jgi:hypothetical protein